MSWWWQNHQRHHSQKANGMNTDILTNEVFIDGLTITLKCITLISPSTSTPTFIALRFQEAVKEAAYLLIRSLINFAKEANLQYNQTQITYSKLLAHFQHQIALMLSNIRAWDDDHLHNARADTVIFQT
jgi:hypothetical protein